MEAVSLSYKEIDSVPFTLTRPHPGGSEQTAWGTWRHEAPHSTAFCNESKLMTPEGTEQEARSHLQSRCFSWHTEGVRPEPWAGLGLGLYTNRTRRCLLRYTGHRTMAGLSPQCITGVNMGRQRSRVSRQYRCREQPPLRLRFFIAVGVSPVASTTAAPGLPSPLPSTP